MTDQKQAMIDELCEKFESMSMDYGRENECKYHQIPHFKLLRELLSEAVVVYGSDRRPLDSWNEKEYESTSHVALLIGIKPLSRAVKVSEVVELLRKRSSRNVSLSVNVDLAELADRIEAHGIEG